MSERVQSGSRGAGRVYHGWFVVATVTTMLAVTSGARFLFGVVLKPLSEEFGWSRDDLSTAVTINVVILPVLQPLIGIAVDRWGSRRILLLGTVGTALLSLPITLANQLWQIYLFYSVIAAISFAAMSPVNITKLISGWFTKRRGHGPVDLLVRGGLRPARGHPDRDLDHGPVRLADQLLGPSPSSSSRRCCRSAGSSSATPRWRDR